MLFFPQLINVIHILYLLMFESKMNEFNFFLHIINSKIVYHNDRRFQKIHLKGTHKYLYIFNGWTFIASIDIILFTFINMESYSRIKVIVTMFTFSHLRRFHKILKFTILYVVCKVHCIYIMNVTHSQRRWQNYCYNEKSKRMHTCLATKCE